MIQGLRRLAKDRGTSAAAACVIGSELSEDFPSDCRLHADSPRIQIPQRNHTFSARATEMIR